MERIYAAIAALALLTAPAVAGDQSPLSPGNAAGVHKAQDADNSNALYIIAGGAVIAGIVVLASDNKAAPAPSPATGTTTTST